VTGDSYHLVRRSGGRGRSSKQTLSGSQGREIENRSLLGEERERILAFSFRQKQGRTRIHPNGSTDLVESKEAWEKKRRNEGGKDFYISLCPS